MMNFKISKAMFIASFLSFILIPMISVSQTVEISKTFAWDKPITFVNGEILPDGFIIKYQLCIKVDGSIEDLDGRDIETVGCDDVIDIPGNVERNDVVYTTVIKKAELFFRLLAVGENGLKSEFSNELNFSYDKRVIETVILRFVIDVE